MANDSDLIVETNVEEQVRLNNFMIDIQNAQKRWHCIINPVVTISGRGIQTSIEYVALSKIPNIGQGS